jgi:hypothetical protein
MEIAWGQPEAEAARPEHRVLASTGMRDVRMSAQGSHRGARSVYSQPGAVNRLR